MSVTNIRSAWVDGNLVFGADYGGQATDGTYIRLRTGLKVHRRTTAEAWGAEIKTEFTDTDAAHRAIDCTADAKAAGTTGFGNIAVSGVSRLAATYTATAGTIQGLYGQVAVNGTVNGSGIMLNAVYGLVEDGGTYTAVGRLAVAWLDSHLTKTISSGASCFLYITNNGSTTFDEAIYVYGGNKITSLLNINTASGMVSADTAGGGTLNFSNWKTIKIVLGGETHYLVAAKTIA